jgi:hypothetical protein
MSENRKSRRNPFYTRSKTNKFIRELVNMNDSRRRRHSDRRAVLRNAAVILALIVATGHAGAVEVPPCAPPELVVLDPATAATLIQALPGRLRRRGLVTPWRGANRLACAAGRTR